MSTLRTVLLHHAPDPAVAKAGSAAPHFDFLLETDHAEPDDRKVATWRIPLRIDLLAPGEGCQAERIQDHRGEWLEQTGVTRLDQGRGIVTPTVHGTLEIVSKNSQQWLIDVSWNSQEFQRYRLDHPASPQGRIERIMHPKDPT